MRIVTDCHGILETQNAYSPSSNAHDCSFHDGDKRTVASMLEKAVQFTLAAGQQPAKQGIPCPDTKPLLLL